MSENNTKTNEPKALSMLLREHCGLPGETAGEFMKQMKNLTPKDREDLTRWFEEMGHPVKPTAQN